CSRVRHRRSSWQRGQRRQGGEERASIPNTSPVACRGPPWTATDQHLNTSMVTGQCQCLAHRPESEKAPVRNCHDRMAARERLVALRGQVHVEELRMLSTRPAVPWSAAGTLALFNAAAPSFQVESFWTRFREVAPASMAKFAGMVVLPCAFG